MRMGLYSMTLVIAALVATAAAPSSQAQSSSWRPLFNGKGEGYMGYDPYTDEIGGKDAIKARYWGPTPNDRRHNLVFNYSYIIPALTETPVAKQLLSNWQISGVARWLSGQAVTPSCTSNNAGIQNTDPGTAGWDRRCIRRTTARRSARSARW